MILTAIQYIDKFIAISLYIDSNCIYWVLMLPTVPNNKIVNYYFVFAKIFLQSTLRYDIIISIDTFGVQLYGYQLQKTLEATY